LARATKLKRIGTARRRPASSCNALAVDTFSSVYFLYCMLCTLCLYFSLRYLAILLVYLAIQLSVLQICRSKVELQKQRHQIDCSRYVAPAQQPARQIFRPTYGEKKTLQGHDRARVYGLSRCFKSFLKTGNDGALTTVGGEGHCG